MKDEFRIAPGQSLKLDDIDPDDTSAFKGDKQDAEKESNKMSEELFGLQEKLYAEHTKKLLIVLQAMDTGGKDGTIARVFEGVNPEGVRVINFRRPTGEELDHDFLWRVHKQVPGKGQVVIFNRSHYEDVLVARVRRLSPLEEINRRYDHINNFEKMLNDEGTTIIKFYLHISNKEQRKRLQARLDEPTKQWKFDTNDLAERELWPEYIQAYESALQRTSTDYAPWYVVPANHKWFRNVVVASIIVKTMESMALQYPKPTKDLKTITIQ